VLPYIAPPGIGATDVVRAGGADVVCVGLGVEVVGAGAGVEVVGFGVEVVVVFSPHPANIRVLITIAIKATNKSFFTVLSYLPLFYKCM
jgi:hypothetical protein